MSQKGWREASCTSLCAVRSCAESGCCCAWAAVPMNGCCARSMTTQRVPAMAIASSRSSPKAFECRLSVPGARDRRRVRRCPTSLRRSSRRLLRSRPAAKSGCTRSSSTVTAWARVSSATRCGLISRNGNDWTARLTTLARRLKSLQLGTGWLDGEIVVTDEAGHTSFQALQKALDRDPGRVEFVVFDVLHWDGVDLREQPLAERVAALARIFKDVDPAGPVRLSQHLRGSGTEVWKAACRMGLEGLIAKRRDTAYVNGRSDAWLKLKCRSGQEFVVGGYTEPAGSRAGFGALLLGVARCRGRARLCRSSRHWLRRCNPAHAAQEARRAADRSIAVPDAAEAACRPRALGAADAGRPGRVRGMDRRWSAASGVVSRSARRQGCAAGRTREAAYGREVGRRQLGAESHASRPNRLHEAAAPRSSTSCATTSPSRARCCPICAIGRLQSCAARRA